MSVIWAHEMASGRGGTETLTQSRTWATRQYTRNFQVRTNDRNDGPATIRASGFIPQLLDPYIAGNDIDLGAVATSVSVTQPEKYQFIWDARIEYEGADNPLTRPHIISTGKSVNERVVWQDAFAVTAASPGQPSVPVPITNSAKCYFDPPVTITEDRPVFSVQRNDDISWNPVDLSAAYGNYTNADVFFGFPPNTVLCLGITGTDAFEGGIWYWANNYEFQYRAEGWILRLLDQGTMGMGSVNGKPSWYKIKDDTNGGYVNEPVPLNGGGTPLSQTITGTIQPTDFKFLSYNVYLSTAFGPLGLP